jgi:type VI secretion system protein ImpG
VDVLHVRALCTNRDLPARLPFGDPTGDFQIEGRSDVERVTCLRKPTQPTRAPAREDSRWRLVSHLALNHLSIAQAIHEQAAGAAGENATGLAALREILKLYDFEDSAVTRQRIEGLVGLRSKKVLRRVGRGDQGGFARGVEVELEFDESKYTGSGVFLFASVLERFLGLYTAVNSFTQTAAVVRQRGGVMKKWPPRAGEVQLL